MTKSAGILLATVLTVDGLLHLYWATGHLWPAHDQRTLAVAVLNVDISFATPGVFALACALLLGASAVLARVHAFGVLGQLVPAPLLQLGMLVIAAGLLLRGLFGVAWALGRLQAKSPLFYQLNLWLYTPVCLFLFAAAVIVACSS